MKKIKIINDPISGFIRIADDIIMQTIDHPYFQRLRRIRQLGLTDMVFPGATHTRFLHALGAFQLMTEAVENLKLKGVEINPEEYQALCLAILLHDIGHGPFSHALEHSIVENVSHEQLSISFMKFLDEKFDGKLNLAIEIFNNLYPRKFFHQLISSQLDIDRLDYLRRDSFYCGVPEGIVGSERLIRMMNVKDDMLVMEKKGLYSVENFLLARRSMYWQVYLHKAVIAAEQMMVKTLERAKELARNNVDILINPSLAFFLYEELNSEEFGDPIVLNKFALLDDNDILQALKVWTQHNDKVLSQLSNNIVNRIIPKTEISDKTFDKDYIIKLMQTVSKMYNVSIEESKYFVYSGFVENSFYESSGEKIKVLMDNNTVTDLFETGSSFNSSLITEPVQRFYLCYPQNIKY